ncbi:MAG: SCP-like extracellular, partial [Sphingomonas sp.]|nr:SCP-like extracellular [Sphingomonas sp.]
MVTPLKSVATVLILMALSAPSAAQAQPFDPVAARLLAAHNRERALVGAAPLQWDPFLAASAATYGPPLAALGGQLIHSPRASRPGQRENLW